MGDLSILRSEMLRECTNIIFGMSTRRGGVSPEPLGMNLSFNVGDDEANVLRNRELFFGQLGIKLDELAIPRQIHSATVHRVENAGMVNDCDALVTNVRRVFLCVSVADCVPVFLYDANANVVAGIHAGWRGTAARIVERAVAKMVDEFSAQPSDIKAFLGPSASSCCYSVGEDVASVFESQYTEQRDGKIFVDLKHSNFDQLVHCGVPRDQIEISPLCTISEQHLLHSYRRDKSASGRMMAVIGLV